MLSVTIICIKQPLSDCFKDICGGYNLLRGRKASTEKTTHSCLRSFLLRNRSDKAPLILTQTATPGYSHLKMTMNFSGQSKLWSDCQGLVCWHWSRSELCVGSRNYETFFHLYQSCKLVYSQGAYMEPSHGQKSFYQNIQHIFESTSGFCRPRPSL